MSTLSERIDEFYDSLRHAFAIDSTGKDGKGGLTDDQLALLRKLAHTIVRRRMGAPARLFLESLQPVNFIGSQAMFFLRPFMTFIFSAAEYDKLAQMLEKRQSIEILIQEIQEAEEETDGREQ
ncbi:MAG: hypothetical protein GY800_01030 [Planctomycetes bacterium]|nr:hypothetical protein [Planctomycetota bacterium]